MSIPGLHPRVALGLRAEIKGNIDFITDEDVLYPVGGFLSIHNFTQKRQRFIKLPDRGLHVTNIALSPNKRLIAVAEKSDRPSITIYDSTTLKKKRQLQIPSDKEVTCNEFVTMSFTFDSKGLAAVTGDPDWFMYVFKADKGKYESSCKANNSNNTGTVVQVCCNPNDNNLVILIGMVLFRILACTETVWRQFGFCKADLLNLRCGTWLSQDRFLAGTVEGKFLVVDSGELKMSFHIHDCMVMELKAKEKDELAQTSQTNVSEHSAISIPQDAKIPIKSLISFPKGLAFAYGNGTVHLYEKENPHKYTKRNVFKVPDNNVIREDIDLLFNMNDVNCLAVNPSQEQLLVTCNQNQIFQVKLWGPNLNLQPEIHFSELGSPLHHGEIGAMSTCIWRPILITSGIWDRRLKIWNYQDDIIELDKQYQIDLYGVALHPTGLYALCGFTDKLRFLKIMIDDFITHRELPIRKCTVCSFSKLGHLFACINGNIIQVYSSINFECLYILKGHSGKINSISWSFNDLKMSSCGSEGAVYEWDVNQQKRSAETIIKTCIFSDVSLTNDGKYTYAVGSDGQIRQLLNSAIYRKVLLTNGEINGMVLSNTDAMMFICSQSGMVYSVNLPLIDVAEYNEYPGHNSNINNILITYGDKYVMTSSANCIVFWKIVNAEGRAIQLEKEFNFSSDILISREDLADKIRIVKDLQQRLHELVTEFSYQMRQTETVNEIKIKNIHEGYFSAIEELKEKNEQMENDHAEEISNLGVEMAKTKQLHDEFVRNLEANYNEKLINEYDKFLQLEDKMNAMRNRYESELENLKVAKRRAEETLISDYTDQLNERKVQIEELLEEQTQSKKEHEMIKQQIEDDADREIYELKTGHEKELKEEKDSIVRLRGEGGIIKKKYIAAQKETEELKHSVYIFENEHIKLKSIIINLEKDINDLKKEIAERDSTIQEKEKRILELKRKNQELEKFRFILDCKIKELKAEIEPLEKEIREKSEQNNDMVNELENLQRTVTSLDLQLAELREKLSGTDNDLKKEQIKYRSAKAALKIIRTDLHHLSGLVQDIPKLTRAVRNMYHKHNKDKDFEQAEAEDTEAKNEFLRQRDFMERTIKTLKQQVTKATLIGGSDKVHLVEENSHLITETNRLRRGFKNESKKNMKMEAVLGFTKQFIMPKQAQKKLNDAIATREEIRDEYQEELKAKQIQIDTLVKENQRLGLKIIQVNEDIEIGAKDDEEEG